MSLMQSRRQFLAALSLVGAAGAFHAPRAFAAEGVLETKTVRLKSGALCIAPIYVAKELLRAEGFTDIQYIDEPPPATGPVAHGKVDFDMNFAPNFVSAIAAGEPITLLAGVHVGCFELFGNEGVHGIADLRGKSVGIQALGSTPHVLLTLMVAQLGIDPVKDLHWVTDRSVRPIERFVDGKIDAFLGISPEPQELRARHIGHVMVNTAVDRPWSQYFCCFLGGNADYVRAHPVATKRVLRAILKATDLCAANPTLAAQRLVDGGFAPRYDYALQTLTDNPYDKWREYDPEDTIRFYALRMREAGFIKAIPQRIIAEGTDWRFLTELKRELKA